MISMGRSMGQRYNAAPPNAGMYTPFQNQSPFMPQGQMVNSPFYTGRTTMNFPNRVMPSTYNNPFGVSYNNVFNNNIPWLT